MNLSKSDFLKYRTCPSYFWLWKNEPSLIPKESNEEVMQQRLEQGNEVERYARSLFPSGRLVSSYKQQAVNDTNNLIASGAKTIFQATVITDNNLLAMADVIEYDESRGGWKLYEVKSTNTVDEKKHLPDIAFQKVAFEAAGYNIVSLHIIHMNKAYVKTSDDIDPAKLLTITDVSDQVDAMLPAVKDAINLALENMKTLDRPKACPCRYESKGQHCPTFAVFNTDIPDYSVYDISRMRGKKLAELIDNDVLDIKDVPDDFSLSGNQKMQVEVAKKNRPHIDKNKIATTLNDLEYPLYFLDYESIAPALPFMNGTHPYQQNVFQYSLHIIDSPNAELRHHEYLMTDTNISGLRSLVASLRDNIGDTGTIISWHKIFERDRNKELANMFPEYSDFMLGLNDRMFDLKDIFSQNMYVHPDSKGSNSIKDILPVLAPDLSYKVLGIQKGDLASIRWFDCTVLGNSDQASQVYSDLLEYCKLDTFAMIEIYRVLGLIGHSVP